MTFINLVPPIYFHVKQYGALVDGVTDDSVAFTAAYTAAGVNGGVVAGINGGTLVKGNDTLLSNVIVDAGGGTIKLKNGANTDLFSAQTGSINLSAAIGTGPTGTLFNFGFRNVTLDGNKANQSSGTSYPLRAYGYNPRFYNFIVKNGYSGGVLLDWNGSGLPTPDSMEGQSSNIKVHDNNGIGWQMGGPHDSQFSNFIVENSGSHNLHLAPNAVGTQFTNFHSYAPTACGVLIEAGYCLFANSQSEGSGTMNVAMLASECKWDGHIFYPGGNGLQLGQQAGQTPYAGQILQAAGVTTAVITGNCMIDSLFDDCTGSHGAIWFANSGGGNHIRATAYQTSGNYMTGTPSPQDAYWIVGKGLTPDGTLGKSGGIQMASSAYNSLLFNDQSGNQFMNINANSKRFGIASSGQFNGYSDAFFSTLQWQIDSTHGDIQTNGNISLGVSATSPDPGAAGTIATADVGIARVTPAAARTGIILAVGTISGQGVFVVNESTTAGNSITFNTTPATSHVANAATATAINGGQGRTFKWTGTFWFPSVS